MKARDAHCSAHCRDASLETSGYCSSHCQDGSLKGSGCYSVHCQNVCSANCQNAVLEDSGFLLTVENCLKKVLFVILFIVKTGL